jgi:hypothetical protein
MSGEPLENRTRRRVWGFTVTGSLLLLFVLVAIAI